MQVNYFELRGHLNVIIPAGSWNQLSFRLKLQYKKGMSSHHFVREDQEPALLIAGPVSYEAIADLLEWAPYIMVSEQVLELVLSWGIKIDLVLDNTGRSKPELFPFPVEVADYQGGIGVMLEKAFEILEARDQKNVHIAVENARLVWPELTNFEVIQVVLLTEEVRWHQVNGTFEKWVPAGSVFFMEGAGAGKALVENLVKNKGAWTAQVEGIIRVSGAQELWLGESR